MEAEDDQPTSFCQNWRADRQIAVFEHPGLDPVFVLMHGFPDNSRIYNQLLPLLVGRHVVAFDFLGWGASDKPMPPRYMSES